MRRGWVFLIPLGLLVYTLMVANWEPGRAGMVAAIATVVIGALHKATRPTWRGLVTSLEGTGRTLLDIVVITGLAGVVIGTFQLSGLSFKFSLLLVSVAGGKLLVLLVLTAVVCILLGMSLPTTVVYITLAVLVGPALGQLGVDPLAGHLFLFYFGMLSLITPPDCLATYTAAAIAHSDFWKTGWTGMRLGVAAYVVPFAFVLHPALILKGTAGEVALAILTASVAVVLLGVGCAGYLFRPLGWGQRALAFLAGLLLLLPAWSGMWLLADAAGLVLGVSVVLWEWAATRPERAPVPQPGRRGA
jgi:TRAP-type uncharacterized transport system fused permease subunit